ncbi:MAG: hypothetical protein ACK54F_10755 [Planctomycetia bacterium]|jgi:hypothetical protein
MNSPVCFHQGCPVCGRTLRIRVTLLGKRVYCQHCRGGFVAVDPSMGSTPPSAERVPDSMVDELIERAEWMLQQTASTDRAEEAGW